MVQQQPLVQQQEAQQKIQNNSSRYRTSYRTTAVDTEQQQQIQQEAQQKIQEHQSLIMSRIAFRACKPTPLKVSRAQMMQE
jgi:hypothetical protein